MSDKLKPISTAPREKWILLAGDSGYTTTPLRFEAGKFDINRGYWVDHSGEPFANGGPEPIYWMEIPEVELERKSFNEWLQTKEYEGITCLDDKSWQFTLMTQKEFEEKLLNSRVQISADKLKELLNKK